MNSLQLKSPAKLNLYLDVLRRRPDGYHDIETVFEKIALFDTITIQRCEKGVRITTDDPRVPAGAGNLVHKAIRALRETVGFEEGVWVDIKKRIPVAGGLGGGSSDAAATLAGISRLFKLGLSTAQQMAIAGSVGADVPFFLHACRFGIGTGRGDMITPIHTDIALWHIIVSFNFGIPTKDMYEALNLGLTPRGPGAKICVPFLIKKDVENLGCSLYNRFEEVALRRYAVVGAVKRLLLAEGAYGAVMSGSGPTVFGITRTREEAIGVTRRIRKRVDAGCRIMVVNTMSERKE